MRDAAEWPVVLLARQVARAFRSGWETPCDPVRLLSICVCTEPGATTSWRTGRRAMNRRTWIVAAAVGLLLPVTLLAQAGGQNFPGSKMTILIPAAPGGGTDLLGRILAERLEAKWRNVVLV